MRQAIRVYAIVALILLGALVVVMLVALLYALTMRPQQPVAALASA